MKILHLLESNRFSGAENVVCQIITLFQNNQDVEMVYCSRDGQIREILAEKNIAFVPIEKMSKENLQKVIAEQKPDIIHAHDRLASYYAAQVFKNRRIIVHMHVNNNKGIKTLLKNILWTYYSRFYEHIFWVSNSAFRGFQFHRIVKNKSSVLYNVINPHDIYEKAELDMLDYSYDVVYVGRLSYQKNPQMLIDVCHKIISQNPEIKIAIVGTGEYSEYIQRYIRENSLEENINYLGYMSNPLKLIQKAKCLVMTSRFEGTPMVALEAQILGVPIVSTPVDGLIDIIKNGENGYLNEKTEEMVAHILKIIQDDELHLCLSQRSVANITKLMDIERYKAVLSKKYGVK